MLVLLFLAVLVVWVCCCFLLRLRLDSFILLLCLFLLPWLLTLLLDLSFALGARSLRWLL